MAPSNPTIDLLPAKYAQKRKLVPDELSANEGEDLVVNYPSSASTINEETEYDENVLNVDESSSKRQIKVKTNEQLQILQRYLDEGGTDLPTKESILKASLETKLEFKQVKYFFQRIRRTNNKKSGKKLFLKVRKTDEQIRVLQKYFSESNNQTPSLEIRRKISAETNLVLKIVDDWFTYHHRQNLRSKSLVQTDAKKIEKANGKKTPKRKEHSLETSEKIPVNEKKSKTKKDVKLGWKSILDPNSSLPIKQQSQQLQNLNKPNSPPAAANKQKLPPKEISPIKKKCKESLLAELLSSKTDNIDPYEFPSEPLVENLEILKSPFNTQKTNRRRTLGPVQLRKTLNEMHSMPEFARPLKKRRDSLSVGIKLSNYPMTRSKSALMTETTKIEPAKKKPPPILNSVCLQNKACYEYTNANLDYCRECSTEARNREDCRFWEWRKLKSQGDELISACGFLSDQDITESDRDLWSKVDEVFIAKSVERSENISEVETHAKMISLLAPAFEKILKEEAEWQSLVKTEECRGIFWKKLIEGTRETCDLCKTYIFNGHFACRKCGFSVCLDCFKLEREKKEAIGTKNKIEVDERSWLYCNAVSTNNLSALNQKKKEKSQTYSTRNGLHILYTI
jgi:hypothetical protein